MNRVTAAIISWLRKVMVRPLKPDQIIEKGAEVAARVWRSHFAMLVMKEPVTSLSKLVSEFREHAFREMTANVPDLRAVSPKHLALIYYKGLIQSKTHIDHVMAEAIRECLDHDSTPNLGSGQFEVGLKAKG